MKRNTPTLIGLTFIFAFIFSSVANAQELKPHNVIISSSYYETSKLAPIRHGSSKLMEAFYSKEPYFPSFQVTPLQASEDYAHNIRVSGLTKSFGEFSELFLGDAGVLENAFLLFLKEEYDEAEEKLLSLLPSESEVGKKATLLLSWTKYKKGQFDSALIYAKSGFNSKDSIIEQESYYICSLILLKQNQYDQIKSVFKPYAGQPLSNFWNARLAVVYTYSLTKLNKWNDAGQFAWKLNIDRFAHSSSFYKLHEIEGVIFFKLKHYSESLESLKAARALNPNLDYRTSLDRLIAWAHYFLGSYAEAISLTSNYRNTQPAAVDDELQYLRVASFAHLQDWSAIKSEFEKLAATSPFFKLAAFVIQTNASNQPIDDGLKKQLAGIRYDFPEMKFYTALLNGINSFRKGLFEEAETQFFSATAIDVNNAEYSVALFNLALTQLKRQLYPEAYRNFTELLQLIPGDESQALHYHLLFCMYQLEKMDTFLDHVSSLELETFEDSLRWEIMRMQGNIQLTRDNNEKAAALFFRLWDQSKQIAALESAVIALYRDKQFERIIAMDSSAFEQSSETLFIYRTKSHLGNQQFKQALKKIETTKYTSEAFVQLQVEVWLANRQYNRIISRVTKLLNRSLSQETRLLYYLSLGDAYFNLKNFEASKSQFFKALDLTDDLLRKSLIQYNIALITYYKKDYPSFLKETNVILANQDLTPEIRYNLTQLLVNFYQQDKQPEKADRVLDDYISNHEFQRTKANLKRLHLLYVNGFYLKCFQLANLKEPNENAYQARDRIILYGYCGNHIKKPNLVIDRLNPNLKQKQSDYRKSEITLVLAEAYFLKGDYKSARWLARRLSRSKLSKEITYRNRLLLVDSLVHLNDFKEAKKEFGLVDHYRQTQHFTKALKLNAEILADGRNIDQSVRSLLRVYYAPDSPTNEKIESLIRICEIYLSSNHPDKIKPFYSKIDGSLVKQHTDLNQRYVVLTEKLSS